MRFMQTAAAAAIASAFFCGSAFAETPTVTLYGIVNTGLSYTHQKTAPGKSTDTVQMDSGNYLGSRFGLKGEEKITDTTSVGFILENGFSSDTGTESDDNRIFGREASLYAKNTNFGTLRFGRLTQLTGSTGSSSIMGGKFSALSTGWGIVYGHNAVFAGKFARFDNVINYSTPTWNGFDLHLQYSGGIDMKSETPTGRENTGSTTRYGAIGARYMKGAFSTIGVVDTYHYANTQDDAGYTANLSVANDFNVAKVFLAGQYFKDMRYLGKAAINDTVSGAAVFGNSTAKDGWGINLGATAPAFGGKFYAAVGYMDADHSDATAGKLKRYTVSLGYDYSLSKRTLVYAGAGYMHDKYDDFAATTVGSAYNYGVTAGLVHKF